MCGPAPPQPGLTEFFKQSSSTSKLEVSVGLLTSGMYGASHVRMFSQSMPENRSGRLSHARLPRNACGSESTGLYL